MDPRPKAIGSAISGPESGAGPAVTQFILRGSIGFAVVSVAAFSVWAFGGKRLQPYLGEAGLYTICALVFLSASGLVLHSLVPGNGSRLRFYAVFIPAFIGYAGTWCAAWFLLHFGLGEYLGSLLGSLVFTFVAGWRLRNQRGWLVVALLLFGFHSAGYFLGGKMMGWVVSAEGRRVLSGLSRPQVVVLAKLCWGLCYGLGFGAGIGYVFHAFQRGADIRANGRPAYGSESRA